MKPGQIATLDFSEDERFKGATVTLVEPYGRDAWIVRLENPGNAPNYAMPDDRLIVRPEGNLKHE